MTDALGTRASRRTCGRPGPHAFALLALSALVAPSMATAEPHFTALTGLICGRCHVSPTGGGKRTAYGALYAATTLTLAHRPATGLGESPGRTAGAFELGNVATSGQITRYLALGADLRVANTTTWGADTQNSFQASEGNLYLELSPIAERVTIYFDEQIAATGARSREAYVLLSMPVGQTLSVYVRGGWFLPPFGLRLLDDDTLTRRATGANFQNSDLGAEVGLDAGPVFAALAVTNGSFAPEDNDVYKALWLLLQARGPRLWGGVSAMYNPSEAGCRAMAGTHGGVRLLGRLVLQFEADYIAQRPAQGSQWTHQQATFVEAQWVLVQGLSLRVSHDFHDGNLELAQERRQRFVFGVDAFLLPMVEAKLYYALKQAERDQPMDRDDRLEATLHVYF